jgi:hypothetical protein
MLCRSWQISLACQRPSQRVTTQRKTCMLSAFDNALNLVLGRGCLPGYDGTHTLVRDDRSCILAQGIVYSTKGMLFPAGTEG